MAVAAQVVASQIDKHHVFGILLRVVLQILCVALVFVDVASALGGAGYRVDISLERISAFLDAAMCLGRTAEDAEAAKVHVEEIWRRIDRTQGAVELEVVALVMLHEAARQHYLEHIASLAVGNASADIGLVLFVGEWRSDFSHRMELIDWHIESVESMLKVGNLWLLAFWHQLVEIEQVVEVVELKDEAEQHIEHIGRIVDFLGLILDVDIVEIANGIRRGVAPQRTDADLLFVALKLKLIHELADQCVALVLAVDLVFETASVGIVTLTDAMADRHLCQLIDTDIRMSILARMVVARLHQDALF